VAKTAQLKQHGLGKRTGNNCQHLTRLLLGFNPLSGALPAGPSWSGKKKERVSERGANRRGRTKRT
jgi:hypothetical protein